MLAIRSTVHETAEPGYGPDAHHRPGAGQRALTGPAAFAASCSHSSGPLT